MRAPSEGRKPGGKISGRNLECGRHRVDDLRTSEQISLHRVIGAGPPAGPGQALGTGIGRGLARPVDDPELPLVAKCVGCE